LKVPKIRTKKSDVEDALKVTLHDLQVHQVELETQNEELRRTQLLLDQSTARYFDLYDLAPVGYCSLSEEGIILEANLSLCSMLGVNREALRGEKISRFIAKEYQDIYYLFRQMSFKHQTSQSCDVKMLSVKQDEIWAGLVSNLMKDSSGLSVLRLVITDVTDRKLMAAAMQMSEARYRTLVEWSPEPTIVHSEGNILYGNQAALELLGLRFPHEIVNTSVTDWLREDFHEVARNRWKVGGELYASTPMIEQVIIRKNGEQRDVEVRSLTTLFDEKVAIQIVARDVTQRKQTEKLLREVMAELREAKTRAEKANIAKSDFLSGMGHDLRTPLHSIIGYAQLLESGVPPLVASQTANLNHVISAGWYLLKLINELLNLASIEAGQVSIEMQAVPLVPLLLECESMLSPQAEKLAVAVTGYEVDRSLSVIADPTRLKQVMCNLLSNAIKYNRKGGTVRIECVPSQNDVIRISVSDTGQGLSTDQLAQLFQPFHRLDKEITQQEGTGIGLVVSKRLVELMGGKIGVESTLDIGTTFWIELPRATI
jgi:PAS domain S-box-containing protein